MVNRKSSPCFGWKKVCLWSFLKVNHTGPAVQTAEELPTWKFQVFLGFQWNHLSEAISYSFFGLTFKEFVQKFETKPVHRNLLLRFKLLPSVSGLFLYSYPKITFTGKIFLNFNRKLCSFSTFLVSDESSLMISMLHIWCCTMMLFDVMFGSWKFQVEIKS